MYVRLLCGNFVAIGIKNGEEKLIEVKANSKDEARAKAKGYFETEDIVVAPIPAMVGVLD